jgi:hypothetical protein
MLACKASCPSKSRLLVPLLSQCVIAYPVASSIWIPSVTNGQAVMAFSTTLQNTPSLENTNRSSLNTSNHVSRNLASVPVGSSEIYTEPSLPSNMNPYPKDLACLDLFSALATVTRRRRQLSRTRTVLTGIKSFQTRSIGAQFLDLSCWNLMAISSVIIQLS